MIVKRTAFIEPRMLVLAVIVGILTQGVGIAEANNDPLLGGSDPMESKTQSAISGALLGAGTALVITSFLITPKKDVVSGYRYINEISDPVYTTIGNDTQGLLFSGITFMVLGALINLIQSDGSDDDAGETSNASTLSKDIELGTIVLSGESAGVGVSYSF